jgi:hypothetical protein
MSAMSAEDRVFLGLFAAVVALLGAIGVIDGLRRWRQKLALDARRRSSLAQAEGLVELEGRLQTSAPISSPLGGVSCAACMTLIEHGQRRGGWSALVEETATAPLALADGSGEAAVEPDGAEIMFGAPSLSFQGALERAPERVQSLVREKWRGPMPPSGWTTVRAQEWVLRPGDAVVLRGRARRADGGALAVGRDSEAGLEIIAKSGVGTMTEAWFFWLLELPAGIALIGVAALLAWQAHAGG